MTTEIKLRVARRCPFGLPKQHTADEWLALYSTHVAIGGLTIYSGDICVIKATGDGGLLAYPLTCLPDQSLDVGLTPTDRALVTRYVDEWRAGAYDTHIAKARRNE